MASEKMNISQGYLDKTPEHTIRVRIMNNKGFLTIKGKNKGATRMEFEYEIPLEDAKAMMELCQKGIIEKIRYCVPFEGYIWEIDEFKGSREGLVIAEIELPAADTVYGLPPFVGKNVTGDPKYYNSNL
ncbi:MAG: CYTH domain-containing protein [Muribaculaceae bacterium]|nr:CYTH domain-containing protein [Muribaculaceae bacterium]